MGNVYGSTTTCFSFLWYTATFYETENLFKARVMPTLFPHIVAAATILFWNDKTLKNSYSCLISFFLCNENLNSFSLRWGNYSWEETIWGNTVCVIYQNICRALRKFTGTYLNKSIMKIVVRVIISSPVVKHLL